MRTGLYTLIIATSGTILHRVHWRDLCATHCASQKLLGTHTTSHHIAWCPCTDYTKFSCLYKSLGGASPFVSAIAIQLTPSYTSYTTIYPQRLKLETSNFVHGLAMWSLSHVISECSVSGRGSVSREQFLHCALRTFRHSKSSVYRWYPQLVRGRFVYDTYKIMEATRSRHGWVHMFITHCPL